MPQSGLAQGPGGYQQAAPNQKTIVAGMAPPIGVPGMMQGGMPPGVGGMPPGVGGMPPGMGGMPPGMGGMPPGVGGMPPGMGGMPNAQPGGATGPGAGKTMMLQPSEGIVSVARTGQAVQPAGTGMIHEGASTLFWAISLTVGVAVGALAYLIVAAM